MKMLLDVVRVEIVNLNEFRRPTSCKGGFVAKVERHGSSLVLTFMTPNLSKHICQSLIKIKQIKTHFNLVSILLDATSFTVSMLSIFCQLA